MKEPVHHADSREQHWLGTARMQRIPARMQSARSGEESDRRCGLVKGRWAGRRSARSGVVSEETSEGGADGIGGIARRGAAVGRCSGLGDEGAQIVVSDFKRMVCGEGA